MDTRYEVSITVSDWQTAVTSSWREVGDDAVAAVERLAAEVVATLQRRAGRLARGVQPSTTTRTNDDQG